MPDHVHILVEIHPSVSLSDFVRELKISTNAWMKKHTAEFPHFEAWGKSYCALTYCNRDMQMVKDYIVNQKEHHKAIGFEEEYVSLLREFGIEPDKWMFAD